MNFSDDKTMLFGAPSQRRGTVAAILASMVFALLTPGCQAPRGGWDLAAVQSEYPAIEELSGHRLGDMLPFPSFEGDHVVLRACRFPSGAAIRVVGDGPGWPPAWARLAVSALDRGAPGFALALGEPSEGAPRSRDDSEIRITSVETMDESAPTGLADTLSVCDISPEHDGRGKVRGRLLGSGIRIRRSRLDWRGQRLDASAEEWVGALMHEIGHALGFSGHAATGHSILVRDERHLRAAGRRALAGESWRDETLEALYQLRPGERLGTRRLSAKAISTLQGIRELVERDSASGFRGGESRSSVGDWQARVEWLLSDGRRLSVRMLHWRDELQSGGEITLFPDTRTRIALQGIAARGDVP